MSTANFNSNQLGFPLYAREYCYSKVCPECGAWNMDTAESCEECGENLENVDPRYDECDTDCLVDEVWSDMRSINEGLEFFRLGIASGYYSGLQFDVDWNERIGDPEDLDNEDAHYYFDCCRSEMLRRYQRERRKLGKKLKELAEFYGFEAYGIAARFSNGEVWYTKIETPAAKKYAYKAKLAAAVHA